MPSDVHLQKWLKDQRGESTWIPFELRHTIVLYITQQNYYYSDCIVALYSSLAVPPKLVVMRAPHNCLYAAKATLEFNLKVTPLLTHFQSFHTVALFIKIDHFDGYFLQNFTKICKRNHIFDGNFDHIPGTFCIFSSLGSLAIADV